MSIIVNNSRAKIVETVHWLLYNYFINVTVLFDGVHNQSKGAGDILGAYMKIC